MNNHGDLSGWTRVCAAAAELKLASISARMRQVEHAFGWHSHPFFECGLILEGGCCWYIGKDSYDLVEGEAIIVPPGAAHREWIAPGGRARLSWIGFVSSALDGQGQAEPASGLEVLPDVAENPMLHGDFVRAGGSGVVQAGVLQPLKIPTGRWSAEIRRLFLTIYDEQGESAFGAERRIDLCLHELLLLLLRLVQAEAQNSRQRTGRLTDDGVQTVGVGSGVRGGKPTRAVRVGVGGGSGRGADGVGGGRAGVGGGTGGGHAGGGGRAHGGGHAGELGDANEWGAASQRQVQLVHAASRYFDNNTDQGVTIESVARYFRLTPQYFSTLFRRVHGISPARYQQEARVRHACRLLLGSQLSIKEIASLCGYADSPHFCRQFRAHQGCSPAAYRLQKKSLAGSRGGTSLTSDSHVQPAGHR